MTICTARANTLLPAPDPVNYLPTMSNQHLPPPRYQDDSEAAVETGGGIDDIRDSDPLLVGSRSTSPKQVKPHHYDFSEESEISAFPPRYDRPAHSHTTAHRRAFRGIFLTIGYLTAFGLIFVLATPLVLLYRQGVFDDGLQSALLKPHADHTAFPTNVGFEGPTPTGSEAGLLLNAPSLPLQTAQPPLVPPTTLNPPDTKKPFNVLQHWGHLSPWFSIKSHGLKEATSLQPEGCEIQSVHWLQRHGARYPTLQGGGPAEMAERLEKARGVGDGWISSGKLEFLNAYHYKMGGEILTPFGRQQLFNLGVSARIKYGFLLDKFKGRLPVFRTESQNRMLRSAQNFATGFFGYPAEEQYNLNVIIESPGFNNTLAPYLTCDNDGGLLRANVSQKLSEWDRVFLKNAVERLNGDIQGYNITIQDAVAFMETCAYETVAVGYSSFCELFTEEEWKGFEYRMDLMWWYSNSFGSAISRAQGLGWMQELVSRLSLTRMTEFNSTTNSTLHDDVHFPLGDPLYVDFTHDTVFAVLLPTLNLTSFAASGPLPTDHIPKHRSFISSKFCPFATNLQFQVLSCPSAPNGSTNQIRLILNDGVVPLTGLNNCPEDEDGMCPLETAIEGWRKIGKEVDWESECLNPAVDYGKETLNGSPMW